MKLAMRVVRLQQRDGASKRALEFYNAARSSQGRSGELAALIAALLAPILHRKGLHCRVL